MCKMDSNNIYTLEGYHADPVRYNTEYLEQLLVHTKLTINVI